MRKSLFLLFYLSPLMLLAQEMTISGKVMDKESDESLLFATVYIDGTSVHTTSNEYGFFSLTFDQSKVKGDSVVLKISYVGYQVAPIVLVKGKSHKIDIRLSPKENTFKTFEVHAEKTIFSEELRSTQMSMDRIDMRQAKIIPSIGGEVDVMKVVQLLPGVSKGIEGTSGIFVRGGDADQNLVLLDEAPIYEFGHLFGFFSVFNADVIKDITMIKGAFPANYGGRLSSIMDLKMKEGNKKQFHATGGVGLLSSRLTLEGPIKKEKISFLVSGRRTYIDRVLRGVPYYFYDINIKLNYKINDNNHLFYNFYYGKDILKLAEETSNEDSTETGLFTFGFDKGNITNTISWNHIYNDKLFSNITFLTTSFKYDIEGDFLENNVLIKSKISDVGIKADYQWYKSDRNTMKFGMSILAHEFNPNIINSKGEISDFLKNKEADPIKFSEFALYANSDYDIIEHVLKLSVGLRLGTSALEDSETSYGGLEPRIAMRYSLSEFDAFKGSYSRMQQHMHRVSSSTVALPTDLWYPVTENVKPQTSDQIAIGYNHVFDKAKVMFSIEAYYKWMDNLIEYREGANLILNDNFEEELVQGKGDAYGIELLFKRTQGRLNGWIGYTLAWSTRDYPELNDGKRFYAKYDRRNDLSVVLNYRLSKRWQFSTVWVYATGSRFTALVGQYLMPNPSLTGVDVVPLYTSRNEVKLSDSHRLDFNFILNSKENKDKRWQWEWHFGAYNLYNRAAPFRIEVAPNSAGTGYQYQQPGLFGFIPSIAFNFKF